MRELEVLQSQLRELRIRMRDTTAKPNETVETYFKRRNAEMDEERRLAARIEDLIQ